ncbi:hypothetical protein [Sporosarcina sp. Te-1]|uniref:hypothetical protein n=1 Tax=Sporosarcina sp. Te-1 TaxID=2818390 RepID=UPI001A9F6B6D|nr:hypothetical protein [Sporosarcina sp. Te-1]QTD40426.1 hypothetical protein J3U78_16860 [Sporosarcina sp. Te-1]
MLSLRMQDDSSAPERRDQQVKNCLSPGNSILSPAALGLSPPKLNLSPFDYNSEEATMPSLRIQDDSSNALERRDQQVKIVYHRVIPFYHRLTRGYHRLALGYHRQR